MWCRGHPGGRTLDWNALLHHWFSLLIEPCLSHLADKPQSAWTICASLVSNRLILLGLQIGHLVLQPAEAYSGSVSEAQEYRPQQPLKRDWRATLRPCLKFFLEPDRIKYGWTWMQKKIISALFHSYFMYSTWCLYPLPQYFISLSLCPSSLSSNKFEECTMATAELLKI